MKKNSFVEFLVAIISFAYIIMAFNAIIDKYIMVSDADSEQAFVIAKSTKHTPFPSYKSNSTQQPINDNYSIGLPAIEPIGMMRNAHKSNNIRAVSDTRTTSYTVTMPNNTSQMNEQANSGVPFTAYRPSNKSTENTSSYAMRSFYTSSLSHDIGPSKVPFSSTTTDIILVDPKSDPDAKNRIPIGGGEYILICLGLIYLKYKTLVKNMQKN